MFLNDSLRRSVLFVGAKRKADYRIGGTAFLAFSPIEQSDGYRLYIITARHVVEEARALSNDGFAYVRANTRDGRSVWQKISDHEWEFHSDDRVDAAAVPLDWTQDDFFAKYNHTAIAWDHLADERMIKSFEIRPGEGLFFPGLFVRVPGMQSNLPILRTGTVAALPERDEPISTTLGMAWVYLAEIRSIGGHSGSPVFVHFDAAREIWMQERSLSIEAYPLLGLIHGHFPLRPDQLSAHIPNEGEETSSESFAGRTVEDYSSGIAAIVPASLIKELLLQPALVAERQTQRAN